MTSKIDLHIHTTASDGTDSVRELLANIKKQGVQIFSVTDHDTIDGSREMADLVGPDLVFLPGVEFSCKTSRAKCHILGYGFDSEHPELQETLAEGERLRREKLDARLRFLEEVRGICFPEEVLARLYALKTVGKPHIAREMIELGMADSIDDAIQNYINGCKVGDDRIDAEKAIRAIRAAGGVAVWAHPLGGEGSRHLAPEEFRARLEVLLTAGIQGLECHYSRYTRAEAEFLEAEARKHGLYVTGGSDYHGQNKNISLGELNTECVPVSREALTLLQILVGKSC